MKPADDTQPERIPEAVLRTVQKLQAIALEGRLAESTVNLVMGIQFQVLGLREGKDRIDIETGVITRGGD